MMRLFNTIILLTAVATITACNIEPIDERGEQGLSFSVVLDGSSSTKAESLGLYSEDGKVTSFTLEQVPQTKSVQINHATTFTQIYDSFQVEGRENNNRKFYDYAQYNSSTGLWDLQNSSYLWQPGHVIEIVAAASGMDNTQFFAGLRYNGNPSTAMFNYALPETHASQLDYLIGYYKGEIADGTVSLKFNHPLTSLVFEVGPLPLGVTLQVNSITLEGIDAEAICDVTFGETTTYVWRDYSGTTDYTQVIENPQPKVEGDDILDETASFIVIPRTFPANSEARIVLNITDNGRDYDMYAPLAGQVWNPGETNIYQLSYHGDSKAILLDGPSFNAALASLVSSSTEEYADTDADSPAIIQRTQYTKIPDITKIVFETNSNVSSGILVNAPGARPIYMNYNNGVVTISTDDFIFYTGESCREMFAGLTSLQQIDGLEKVNTKAATNMRHLFGYCVNLRYFNLSHLNTENVTDMLGMFHGCERLTTLDLRSFNTNKVTNAAWLFLSAKNLTSINFGDHFQLPKCTVMSLMFACTPIQNLNLNFIIGAETEVRVSYMFLFCRSLTSVNIGNLRSPTGNKVYQMFEGCRNLQSINLGTTNFFENISNDDKAHMFRNTAYNISPNKCTITCTQNAKDCISVGTDIYAPFFEWNIVPQTTEP